MFGWGKKKKNNSDNKNEETTKIVQAFGKTLGEYDTSSSIHHVFDLDRFCDRKAWADDRAPRCHKASDDLISVQTTENWHSQPKSATTASCLATGVE